MKKLILIIIVISATAVYSQWKPVTGLYGGSVNDIIAYNDTIYLTAGNQLYSSAINGNNWNQKNFNYQVDYNIRNVTYFKNKIFVTSIYEGIFVYNKTDESWKKINDDLFENCNYLDLSANDNFIYLSTNHNIYRSNDGVSWEISDTNSSEAIAVYGDQIVYQYGSQKILYSPDNGDTWDNISPDYIGNVTSRDIAINEKYIFSSYNSGLYRTSDLGDTWEIVIYSDIKSIYSIDNIAIFADDEYIYVSDNYGETWTKKKVELNQEYINTIFYKHSSIYLSTENDFFKSTDWGDTWELSNNGINNINYLNFTEYNDEILVTTFNRGICKILSTNNTIAKKFFPDDSYGKIYSYENLIIAHKYMFGGLNISTDNGENWSRADTNNGFTINLNNASFFLNGIILSSTIEGIYISKDSGKVWNRFNPNYMNVSASDTFGLSSKIRSFSHINNEVYVGTDNKGLYKFNPQDYSNWTKVLTNNYFIDKAQNINYVKINNNTLYLNCYDKMFVSDDDGNSWSQIFTDYEKIKYRNIIFYDNYSIISTTSGIYISTGNSDPLVQINDGLGSQYVNDIILVNDKIYAATSSGIFYRDIDELIITSVEVTETQNYLYTYPPYPQPASTEVRSLVYWDTSLEMNKESVKIYNTNGVEVGREQDISFERINAYSGNLIWNCTNVPDGVYLIQISHGDKTQTIKVMVRK